MIVIITLLHKKWSDQAADHANGQCWQNHHISRNAMDGMCVCLSKYVCRGDSNWEENHPPWNLEMGAQFRFEKIQNLETMIFQGLCNSCLFLVVYPFSGHVTC